MADSCCSWVFPLDLCSVAARLVSQRTACVKPGVGDAEAEDGEVGIAVQWEVIEAVLPEELASEIQEEPNEVDV